MQWKLEFFANGNICSVFEVVFGAFELWIANNSWPSHYIFAEEKSSVKMLTTLYKTELVQENICSVYKSYKDFTYRLPIIDIEWLV